MNESEHNIVAVLIPAFTYKRGQLWSTEHAHMRMLYDRGLNLDTKFTLMFEEKTDARDGRPCQLEGRILMPLAPKDDYIWKRCPLLTRSRTELAKMLPVREMVAVEDRGETAMPQSVDDSTAGVTQGANKFEQLGVDANAKLLQSVFDIGEMPGRAGVCVYEMNIGVGNVFDASLAKKCSGPNFPLVYFTHTDDPRVQDWFMSVKTLDVAHSFQNGLLKVPGFAKPQAEVPAEILASAPPLPHMHVMVVDSPGADFQPGTVKVPEHVLKQWYDHPKFGAGFREVVDLFNEEHGVKLDMTDASEAGTPARKRPRTKLTSSTPPRTPCKVDSSQIVDVSSVSLQSLMQIAITSAGPKMRDLYLGVYIGHRLYVLNKSDTTVTLPFGMLIAGFGKGKFKLRGHLYLIGSDAIF